MRVWPDGKRIALAHDSSASGIYTVGILDLRTRHEADLRDGWHPRWSPDGRRLVFVNGNGFGPEPRSQIYVMNADGSNGKPLTRS